MGRKSIFPNRDQGRVAPAVVPAFELDPLHDPVAIAVIDLISERGYESVTDEAIAARAGISSAEFHRRFVNKQDCTTVTIGSWREEFRRQLETAYATGLDWQRGLRASAWAAADFLAAQPALVRVVAVDLLQARNEMLRVLREDTMMSWASFIERGRAAAPDPASVPPGAGIMAMGSMAQLLTHRLHQGIPVEPHRMVRPMLYMAVRPYLGEEAAREELVAARPAAPSPAGR